MTPLSNYWQQNRKERPDRSTNNGDRVDKSKREPVDENLTILLQRSWASKTGGEWGFPPTIYINCLENKYRKLKY